MLSRETIDRHLELYRDNAASIAMLIEAGRPPGLDVIVRDHMEDLIHLAEEVPNDRRAEVDYLIDRYEAMLKSVRN